MISDREVTFFLALGELLADIEQPKRLIEKKLDAFRKARGLTEEYVRRGIREDLVGVILKKKLALILIAKTADEVERPLCASGGGVGYLGHRLSLQHAATRGTGSIYGSLYPSVSHHQRAADQQGHQ